MKPPRTKPSLLFRLIVPATVVFILTVLSLIASVFGDQEAPVSKWLEAHGSQLLIWELGIVVVLSILAMAIDRIRTLRGIDEEPLETPSPAETQVESDSGQNPDAGIKSGG